MPDHNAGHFLGRNVAVREGTGCLGLIGDEILPSNIGIIKNHCKDPYEPTIIS